VIRPHEQCVPDPCFTVTGPVHITHAAVRASIAWLTLLPLAVVVFLYVARQRSYRRMYLSALLVCSVSIVLAVLVPRLFVRPTCCSHFPVVIAWAIGTVGVVVSITLLLLGTLREGQEKSLAPRDSTGPGSGDDATS
jgi:hypothetical protein